MWKWSGVARGVGIRAEVWIPEATPEAGQNLMLLSLFFFGIDSYSKTVFDVPYVIFYTFLLPLRSQLLLHWNVHLS